ncbi:kelch-like protein 41 [Planococcus citri]|uniref:kelch-like protein 41 n=1 Tax=Planococcus citri TaxID=170843 RepID=UPI0031FA026B
MAHLIQTVDVNQVEKTLFKHLNDLRMENLFCDVRFNVNGTIMPCHRVVLSAISPYFRTMFNGNFKESNSDTVTMNDIETETFEEILNAMYTGSIRFRPGNAYFILKASHLFQLEMIENACVSYIMKNTEINFLIETCVFARNIQLNRLYSKCSVTITNNMIEYGKTNSFKKIPLDVFVKILNYLGMAIKLKQSEEEPVLLLIMKWSKHNNASREDIEKILDAPYLKSTRLISPSVMSQLLVCSDDKPMNDASGGIQELHDNDFNLPLNLYLNAIDVETGQRGWVVLKLNGSLDKYVLSSYHPTSAEKKKICRIGTKLYCFEIFENDEEEVMNFFSYDEKDDTRIHLPTLPEESEITDDFEIAAEETSIYLMIRNPSFSVWRYDCETNTWNNVLKKNEHEEIYRNISAYTFSRGSLYIIAQEEMSSKYCSNYIFSITPAHATSVVKKLTTVSLYGISLDNLYFSVFDGKIVLSTVCGLEVICKKNPFQIFDLANCQWLSGLKKMKSRHENFHLFHYDGSVYLLENDRPLIPNEKYDLSSGEWIDLPCLPKRITIPNTSQVLATGKVFGADVNQ